MDDWKKIEISDKPQSSKDPKWDFEENDTLIGVLIRHDTEVGPNKSHIYTLSTTDGEVSVWGKTVLDRRMAQVDPGQKVKIVYLGRKKNSNTGREYMDFDVFVKPGKKENDNEKVNPEDIPF